VGSNPTPAAHRAKSCTVEPKADGRDIDSLSPLESADVHRDVAGLALKTGTRGLRLAWQRLATGTQPSFVRRGAAIASVGSAPSTWWSTSSIDWTSSTPRSGDFNGDGRQDVGLYGAANGGSVLWRWVSTGTTFGAETAAPPPTPPAAPPSTRSRGSCRQFRWYVPCVPIFRLAGDPAAQHRLGDSVNHLPADLVDGVPQMPPWTSVVFALVANPGRAFVVTDTDEADALRRFISERAPGTVILTRVG
jgi:hypothetical protein